MTLLKKKTYDKKFDCIPFPGIWDSKTSILKMSRKTEEKYIILKYTKINYSNLQLYDSVNADTKFNSGPEAKEN